MQFKNKFYSIHWAPTKCFARAARDDAPALHENNIWHQNCPEIHLFHYTFCYTKLKIYLYLFNVNGRDTNFKNIYSVQKFILNNNNN